MRVSIGLTKGGLKTYHQKVCILVQADGRYTLIENRPRVLPRLAHSVSNHGLCLTTIELGLGWLTRKNNANLCREIHGMFPVAAIDNRKLGMLEDTVVCYMLLVP